MLFMACKPNSISMPSVKPSVQSTPTPKTISSEEFYANKYKGQERVIKQRGSRTYLYCEKQEDSKIEAKLKYPIDLAVSNDGNTVYVLNKRCEINGFNNYPNRTLFEDCGFNKELERGVIRRNYINKITSNGKIEALKVNDEYPISCQLREDIEKDTQGNLYVTDSTNSKIYKLSESNIEEYANVKQRTTKNPLGPGESLPSEDSIIYQDVLNSLEDGAYFNGPEKLYFDNGNIYYYMYRPVLNAGEFIINKISPDKKISQAYETSSFWIIDDFSVFKGLIYFNGITSQKSEFLLGDEDLKKTGVKVGSKFNEKGEVFVADITNNIIWKIIIEQKKLIKIAGNGKTGYKDGKIEEAEFNYPTALDFDDVGNIYVADTGNNAIRKITPDGVVSTFYKEK